MQIWVDADACPKATKDILFGVAERIGITITLVTNQYLDGLIRPVPSFVFKSDLAII